MDEEDVISDNPLGIKRFCVYTPKNVLENQLEALLQPDKQPDSSYPIKSFHFPLKKLAHRGGGNDCV